MDNVTITLNGEGLQDVPDLNIQVSITATVNVKAETARRTVTAWLASEVGNMLIGGSPQLVISQRTVWRVPAMLTSSEVGMVGEAGVVDVDAENGELLISPDLKTEILTNVQHLIRPTPTTIS